MGTPNRFMRSLAAAIAVAASATAFAGGGAGPISYTEQAARPGVAPEAVTPRTVPASRGTVTTYASRAAFQTAFPGLPMETFEEGNAPVGNFSVCDSPLDAAGDATCGFAPGTIEAGIAFQDNPGPDPASLILLGANAALNPSKALIANTFADAFDIVFSPPVSATAMDLHSTNALGSGPADTLAIQIFDASNNLIDTIPAAAASGPGNFFGISSPTPIGRISMLSANNRAEGVDNIEFAGQPVLNLGTVAAVDVCASVPANNNTFIEPGEVVNFTIPLNAIAGAFTNVNGVLTSSTTGVTIVTGMGAYGTVPSGGSVSANYSIRLAETVACFSNIDMSLAVTSDQGNFSFPISRLVGQSATIQYNGLPLTIPDNLPAGASSTAIVSGMPGPITSLQVRVATTHTWVGDLVYTLTSPGGTVITLLDQPGVPASTFGCSDNDVNVTFQDGQPNPESICGPGPLWPVTLAAPVTALSTLNGQTGNGTWTLNVSDRATGDTGTLNSWELIIAPAPVGACTVCPATADLSVTLTDAPDPVTAGNNLTYTAVVSNAGPAEAQNVTVSLPIPAGTTFVSGTVSTGGSCTAAALCTLSTNLASGASSTITVTVAVPASTLGGSTINATATVATTTTDPNAANNSATTSTAVVASADLSVTLTASASQVLVNVPVTFTATSTNLGPSDAQNVVVAITLSPDFRYTSHSATGATCTTPQVGNSGVITCTWAGATAPNAQRVLSVVAYSNNVNMNTVSATTSSATTDPVGPNNTATVTVQVGELIEEIPTMGRTALLLLGLMLALGGIVAIRRHS